MTDEKMEKIQRLIHLTGLGKALWKACSNVQRDAAMNKEYSCLSDEKMSIVFIKVLSDLVVSAIVVCDYYFSEEEIDELLELYNRPLMQRFLNLTPQLYKAMHDIGNHGIFNPTIPLVPNPNPNTIH